MLTDCLAAALGAWWCACLFRGARRVSTRLWAAGFAAFALGALCGGTHHGFEQQLGPGLAAGIWKLTLVAMGVGNFLFVAAVIAAHTRAVIGRVLHGTNALALAAHAYAVSTRDDFMFVALHAGFAMLALIALETAVW